MPAIETMGLRDLFALRERLWADSPAVLAEIMTGLGSESAVKFMQGEGVILRNMSKLQQRIDILESRIAALELQN